MEQSRKRDQGRTSTEYSQTEKTHKEPCGGGVVAIATSSKGQQQLQRRGVEGKQKTSHSLREKGDKTRGTPMQSVNSGGGGRHSNGKSRQRQFQESRKEKDATLQSSHFKIDSSEARKRSGEQVVEECKKGLETRRVQSEEKKEHRLWFRRPKTSFGKSTGVWHTKPGSLKEKKFEHETTRKKKTFKRYNQDKEYLLGRESICLPACLSILSLCVSLSCTSPPAPPPSPPPWTTHTGRTSGLMMWI